MLLGIAGPFQPGDAVTVEIIDIIQYPVFGKRAFAIFDYGFDTAFGLRISSTAQENVKSCGIHIILKSLCKYDIAMIFTDGKDLILIIDDLSWPPAKVCECFDVRLHEISSGPWTELPQDIFIPGVGKYHPESIDHTDGPYRLLGLAIHRDAKLVTPEDMLPPPDYDSFRPVRAGDVFDLGGVTLEAFACPGHSRGHLVYLDREHRILFSGDAVSRASFLLGKEAVSVEEYRDNLIRLRDQLDGKVDRILEGHGSGELPFAIFDGVIQVCQQVLDGDTDRVPYDLRGYRGFTAKKRLPHSLDREDGGFGNLIYREDKLWRRQLTP